MSESFKPFPRSCAPIEIHSRPLFHGGYPENTQRTVLDCETTRPTRNRPLCFTKTTHKGRLWLRAPHFDEARAMFSRNRWTLPSYFFSFESAPLLYPTSQDLTLCRGLYPLGSCFEGSQHEISCFWHAPMWRLAFAKRTTAAATATARTIPTKA